MSGLKDGEKRVGGPNRREFLKTGSAFGAGLGLGGAASYGRIAGANERIRTGHIGVGGRGSSLMGSVKNGLEELAQPVAVCDVYETHRRRAQRKLGEGSEAYSDYRELLDRDDIDAVVIATPDHWHAKIFIDACRAGKDVYVEKPLSLTVAEGRKMVEVARQTGRISQMGAHRHSTPNIVEAMEFIREGGIGKVTRVRCFHIENLYPSGIGRIEPKQPPEGLDWNMWLGPAPEREFSEAIWNFYFRYFWDYSGGFMTDTATHWLDLIQMGIGQEIPRAVTAMGGVWGVKDDREVPDNMEAIWQFDDCIVSYTQCSSNAATGAMPGVQIEWRGTEGTVYLYHDRVELTPEPILDASVVRNRGAGERHTTFKARTLKGEPDAGVHLRNFFECVRTRERCNLDVETGHRSTATTLIGNIAMRAGARLEWDGKAERFTNNDEANRYLSYAYRAPWSLDA